VELQKIASFQVDHTKLEPGMYLSRQDGAVLTYDIRMKKPNAEPVLANGALHSIEHIVATYLRSSPLSDHVIYFGPMGCRTGFYFLASGLSHRESIDLAEAAFVFLASYDGPIPGASARECGNWTDHDLPAAREEARRFAPILASYPESRLRYPA